MKVEGYTKNELRFLSRHVCWMCEQRLDKNSCCGLFERCSEEVMATRRASCLKTYKPRKRTET